MKLKLKYCNSLDKPRSITKKFKLKTNKQTNKKLKRIIKISLNVFRVLTDKHFADNSPSFGQNTLIIYTLQLYVEFAKTSSQSVIDIAF